MKSRSPSFGRRDFLFQAGSAAVVLPFAFSAGCRLLSGSDQRLFRFGVMTDTHVTPRLSSCHKLKKALQLFREKNCELIINAGDIADHFYPDGYAAYRQTTEEVFADLPREKRPAELFTYAWHDSYAYRNHPRKDVVVDSHAAFKEVKTLLGATNDPTDEKTFGGFPFLVFPQFVGFVDNGYFGSDEYERRIAAACAANPGKPVFVVDHIPAYGTVSDSWSWDAGRREVFNRYPQVVHFSGHVHGDISNGLFFWQGGFTEVNAGDLFPTSNSWGVLTVDVFSDRLEIHRWDIRTGEEIATDPLWTVARPYDPTAARTFDHEAFGVLRWDSGVLDKTLSFDSSAPVFHTLPRELFTARPGECFRILLDAESTVEGTDFGIFSLSIVPENDSAKRPFRVCSSPKGASGPMTYIFDFMRPVQSKDVWNPSLAIKITAGKKPGRITLKRVRVYARELTRTASGRKE